MDLNRRPAAGFPRGAAVRAFRVLITLATVALHLTLGVRPGEANLRDPSAWNILVTQEVIDDALVWDGRLAGADDAGGVILYEPATQRMETITTRNGLTSNRVTALAVDEREQIWVGSFGGGVVRIDLARATKPIDGLLDLNITALASDGDFVFYGTQVGAGLIVGGQASATFTAREDGLVADNITTIAAHAGTTWFGTAVGISEFSRAANEFKTRNDGLAGDDARTIVDLIAGPQGIYAATEAGVFRYGEADSLWTNAGITEAVQSLSVLGNDILALSRGPRAFRLPEGSQQWETIVLNPDDRELRAIVGGPDGRIWYVGSELDPSRMERDPRSMFWLPGERTATVRGLFGNNCRGLATDGQGGYWVGTFPVRGGLTRSRADGSVVAYNYLDDGTGNGWATNGVKMAALRHSNGDLWVSEWGYGVTVVRNLNDADPSAAEYIHLTSEDSPLQARFVLRMVEDPQGRIWFANNGQGPDELFNKGIDILENPGGNLRDPGNWKKMASVNSQLEGDTVFGLTFEGINVAWMSISNVGLQRFKYDGFSESGVLSSAFFDDPRWWDTLTKDDFNVTTMNDPRDIQVAADGAVWFATNGQGVFRFRYVEGSTLPAQEILNVTQDTFGASLLSNQVRALRLDVSGAAWAASDAGLNRVTGRNRSELRVDAWTDFFAFVTRGLPSPEVISPIPGSNVFGLEYDPGVNRVIMATQTGAASLDVARLAPPSPDQLSFVVYPNPIRESENVYITGFEGVVDVGIYNLLGVLLATDRGVERGGRVWDTRDITGSLVASGVYLIRISRDGENATAVLAVER